MSIRTEDILAKAQHLSPLEKLELIRGLSESLQSDYQQAAEQDAIPNSFTRTPPVTDLSKLAADFWPDDESINEFIDYVRRGRAADRLSDL